MAEYNNNGMIWRNSWKREGTKAPDCKGTATVNGVKYVISGWMKQGAKGRYTSLVFKSQADDDRDKAARVAAKRGEEPPSDQGDGSGAMETAPPAESQEGQPVF